MGRRQTRSDKNAGVQDLYSLLGKQIGTYQGISPDSLSGQASTKEERSCGLCDAARVLQLHLVRCAGVPPACRTACGRDQKAPEVRAAREAAVCRVRESSRYSYSFSGFANAWAALSAVRLLKSMVETGRRLY